jgi:hypothetical protein
MPTRTSSHESIKVLDARAHVTPVTSSKFDWGNRLLTVAAAFGNTHSMYVVSEKFTAQSGPSFLHMAAVCPLAR